MFPVNFKRSKGRAIQMEDSFKGAEQKVKGVQRQAMRKEN